MKNLAAILTTFIIIVSLSTTSVQAQFSPNNVSVLGTRIGNTNLQPTSIGFRAEATTSGSGYGISLQQQLNKKNFLEGIGTVNTTDIRFTGLYQYHQPLVVKNLSLVMGGGFHFGKTHAQGGLDLVEILTGTDMNPGQADMFYGADLIAGLQYDVPRMPINLMLDVKPALHLGNHPNNLEIGVGFTVRFEFGKGGGGSGNGQGSGTGSGSQGGSSSGSSGSGSGTSTDSGSNSGNSNTSGGGVQVKKFPGNNTGGGSSTGTNTNQGGGATPSSNDGKGRGGTQVPQNGTNTDSNDGGGSGTGNSGGNTNGESWEDDDGGN